jgi:hypothetical protein
MTVMAKVLLVCRCVDTVNANKGMQRGQKQVKVAATWALCVNHGDRSQFMQRLILHTTVDARGLLPGTS